MKDKKLLGLVVVSILMMCFILPTPSSAFQVGEIDWSLNGYLTMETSSQITNRGDYSNSTNPDVTPKADRTTFICENPGNSWIRTAAKFEKFEGVAEIGLMMTERDAYRFIRHGFIAYDFDKNNRLLVGRTWGILSEDGVFARLAWNTNLWGAGELFSFRWEQVQFSHKDGPWTLKMAIQDTLKTEGDDLGRTNPDGSSVPGTGLNGSYSSEDPLPAFYTSASFAIPGFKITPSAFIQNYTLKADLPGDKDVDVLSYAGALNVAAMHPVVGMAVQAEVWYGQNLYLHFAEYQIDPHNGYKLQRFGASTIMGKPIANAAGDDINDVDSTGGTLVFSKFFGKHTYRIGGGYQESDGGISGPDYEDKIHTWAVFTHFEYTIAKNLSFMPLPGTFKVLPGITYYNWGKDVDKNRFGTGKNDLGYDTFVGAYCEYTF